MTVTPIEQMCPMHLAMFNLLRNPIWVIEIANGRLRWANAAALKLWRAETLESPQAKDGAAWESLSVHKGSLDRDGGVSLRLKGPGASDSVDCEVSSLCLEDGTAAMLVEGRVVREASSALAAKRQLEQVLDAAGEGIYGVDANARVTFANHAAAKLTGWASPEAMVGQQSLDVVGCLTEAGRPCTVDESFLHLTIADGVTRRVRDQSFSRRDGSAFPVEYVVSRRLVDGVVEGAVVVFRDVTEQRRAEQTIRDATARLEAILANTPVGLAILGADRVIRLANKAFGAVFGADGADLVGCSAEVLYGSTILYNDIGQRAYPLILAGDTFQEEVLMRRQDGSDIWCSLTARLVGEMVDEGVVWAAIDITERVRNETMLAGVRDELEAQAAELERSNAELEQFAYVASHDLRQPLRLISSYVTLLGRGYADKLDDDAREYIHFARDGAERMDRLIVDMLDYSRIGRRERPLEPVSVADVLDEALLNLDVAITESGASIQRDEGLACVRGDRIELVRLLQNIVGNAVKYRSPDRAPVVSVSAVESGGNWLISVADNGIGIDPTYFERIFGIFQRLHARDQYDGTGIGLAICRKIVDHHGGRIWVEPGLGLGCVFRISLPAAMAGDGEA
jgi:PAS domain S-box-containing protein